MVGRPPFQPDDFIDLHVENDRVWVDLDQRFSKPPRLTGAGGGGARGSSGVAPSRGGDRTGLGAGQAGEGAPRAGERSTGTWAAR